MIRSLNVFIDLLTIPLVLVWSFEWNIVGTVDNDETVFNNKLAAIFNEPMLLLLLVLILLVLLFNISSFIDWVYWIEKKTFKNFINY